MCRNGVDSDPYDGWFLSADPIYIKQFMITYTNTYILTSDIHRISKYFTSTDLGIQMRAADGDWYLYDFNNQIQHVNDVVEMK